MRINTLILASSLSLLGVSAAAERAQAQVVISVGIAPPPLPVYTQPPIPAPGFIWTPGYWAWNVDVEDYYWVPGAWVAAPRPGLLWTPGYWGWRDGVYAWNTGYWGPKVGFYGGVSYGFGYTGSGFAGGFWSGDSFHYNQSVTNISNTTVINNVYNQPVVNNNTTNASFNGGTGGVQAQPTPRDLQAANEQHLAATPDQEKQAHLASEKTDLRASMNHGNPSIAATVTAGDFSPHNIVAAKAAGGPANVAPVPGHDGAEAHHGALAAGAAAAGVGAAAAAAHGHPATASAPNAATTPPKATGASISGPGHDGAAAAAATAAHGHSATAVAPNATSSPSSPHDADKKATASAAHPESAKRPDALKQGTLGTPGGLPPHGTAAAPNHGLSSQHVTGTSTHAAAAPTAPHGNPARVAPPHPQSGAPRPAAHAQPHPAAPKPPAAKPHPAPKKDEQHG